MSRGIWFVAGAGAGVYAMVRGRRAAEALTADGLRDRLGGLEVGLRMFRDEVAQGRVERETELRERYGLGPHGRPELAVGKHRAGGDPHTDRGSHAQGQHTQEQQVQDPDVQDPDIQNQEGSN